MASHIRYIDTTFPMQQPSSQVLIIESAAEDARNVVLCCVQFSWVVESHDRHAHNANINIQSWTKLQVNQALLGDSLH